MAIIADDDWTRQVSSVPMAMKSSTDQKPKPPIEAIACSRPGCSSRLGIAACSSSIPTSSIVRPIIVWPIDCSLSFLEKMNKRLTRPSSIGRLKAPSPPPSPKKVMIHAVAVVPMLAPIMTAMAPRSVSIPALTKLTTITVVADEL